MSDEYWNDHINQNWSLLEKLCKRRFQNESIYLEASNYVLCELTADGFKRLKAYKGNSSFRAFFSVVAQRLLEDFSRKKYGRQRVPHWIKELGQLWEQAYRMLCCERMSRTDTIESLRLSAPGGRSLLDVEEAVETVLSEVPNCGEIRGEPVAGAPDLPEGGDRERQIHEVSPEEAMRLRYYHVILGWLAEYMGRKENEEGMPEDPWVRSIIDRLRTEVNITAEEKFFLRMIFTDRMTVTSAGRTLGFNTNQAHGKYRRLMGRLRKAIEDAGRDVWMIQAQKGTAGHRFN